MTEQINQSAPQDTFGLPPDALEFYIWFTTRRARVFTQATYSFLSTNVWWIM